VRRKRHRTEAQRHGGRRLEKRQLIEFNKSEVREMNGNVVSFQSVIENGMIRLPEMYRE
jgi:hypothetical protein